MLSGEFVIVNKHLLKDLIKLDLWDESMKNRLIAANGSIQDIPEIPDDIKALYKTVWEMKMKNIVDMAADRGAYICQSQSLNIFMDGPNYKKLSSLHFYAWERGLKTGTYYLRTKPATDAIKFTVDMEALKRDQQKIENKAPMAPIAPIMVEDEEEDCLACGS